MASESEKQNNSDELASADFSSPADMFKNMQNMMGQILDRVGSLEKRIEKADDDGFAGGRQSESPIASDTGTRSSTPTRPTTSKARPNTHTRSGDDRDSDNGSTSGFCVQIGLDQEQEEFDSDDDDVLSLMEDKYVVCESVGEAVHDKLARIATSCFTTPMEESKLKEKMQSIATPSNCTALDPPILNDEVLEKGGIDKSARRNDDHLSNVQRVIGKAASVILSSANLLHKATSEAMASSAKLKKDRHAAKQKSLRGEESCVRELVTAANAMLTGCGEAIAMMGVATQELSIRRRYQLHPSLPKDMQAICGNPKIKTTDKLFGDEADKHIKSAKDTFRTRQASRFHPYSTSSRRSSFHSRPFLGQGQRGGFRGKNKMTSYNNRNQRGKNSWKYRGKQY